MCKIKSHIMDSNTMCRTIMRMSHEITEKNKGTDDVVLVGIKRRGEIIADMICSNIEKIEGVKVDCGNIDIKFYRDDLSPAFDMPEVRKAELSFSIVDKKVIIVDDVLYTGRTVRAAIDAIFSLGRPKSIQLAILVDRGHRELPIRADYVGKSIPTSVSERVCVKIPPIDDETGVYLYENM